MGDIMKIAVDKNSYQTATNDGNEYIYLYEDEDLKDLMKTKLQCIEYTECEEVDINLTDYNIPCKKRCKPEGNWKWVSEYKKSYKIGIIIPNYNYVHTIQKCISSILNQTYKNYEIIFVDDCSTDNSVKLVETIKQCEIDDHNEDKIKIVQLKQKRLNGGARNEGYLHLSDDVDYIYYIDSDDWLYDNTVLEKINNSLQSEPDVLFVGLASYKRGKTEIVDIPEYKNKYEAIKGWSGSCGKVIKKELATRQECLYNEGTLKEDRNQHRKICIYMNSFQILKEPCYVWNQENYKSVTTIRGENPLWKTSTIRQYADTYELYLKEKGKDPKIDDILLEAAIMCKKEMERDGDKQY